jgi:mono/diheme cytochrome c family protein
MIVPSTDQKQGRTLRKILLAIVLGLICLSIALAAFHKTPWIVPPAEKARKNPLTASDENLRAAKRIYGQKCDDCHGETGKGDGSDARMYDPAPSDLTDSAKIDEMTDGEIFYQITEGRKPMPAFRKKLTEEQRWQLVLLVRAFAARQSGQPGGQQTEEPGTDK